MRALSAVFLLAAGVCGGQTAASPGAGAAAQSSASQQHRFDSVQRQIDSLHWHTRLSDIAEVDQISYTGPPAQRETNPTGQGAGNPLIIQALTFIPKKLERSKKHPLIVFAHGGVHSNFGISYIHVVRELLEQAYAVVAPDYRGSTGYGSTFYNQIDYGGREVDDVYAGRNWMLERYPFLDPARVGIIGWSHGGLITLLNIFEHPKDFAAAYAGVPVSDRWRAWATSQTATGRSSPLAGPSAKRLKTLCRSICGDRQSRT